MDDFFEDEDKVEMELDYEGFPRDRDFYSGMTERVYNAMVSFARMHGCTCKFRLYIVKALPNTVAMQLAHEKNCLGAMRQAGMEGRN